MQAVFRLGLVLGIFKTDTKENGGIFSIQLRLRLSVALLTVMYELF
jgi:hypothetical protein